MYRTQIAEGNPKFPKLKCLRTVSRTEHEPRWENTKIPVSLFISKLHVSYFKSKLKFEHKHSIVWA
jgi:hypothetical protein